MREKRDGAGKKVERNNKPDFPQNWSKQNKYFNKT